jgi:hypothetical protein
MAVVDYPRRILLAAIVFNLISILIADRAYIVVGWSGVLSS